jgi:hypothetical protein
MDPSLESTVIETSTQSSELQMSKKSSFDMSIEQSAISSSETSAYFTTRDVTTSQSSSTTSATTMATTSKPFNVLIKALNYTILTNSRKADSLLRSAMHKKCERLKSNILEINLFFRSLFSTARAH